MLVLCSFIILLLFYYICFSFLLTITLLNNSRSIKSSLKSFVVFREKDNILVSSHDHRLFTSASGRF